MKFCGLTFKNESYLAAHLQEATFFSFSILQNEFLNSLEFCRLFVLFMHGGQRAGSEGINSTPQN